MHFSMMHMLLDNKRACPTHMLEERVSSPYQSLMKIFPTLIKFGVGGVSVFLYLSSNFFHFAVSGEFTLSILFPIYKAG
jgi:hypothetical protein